MAIEFSYEGGTMNINVPFIINDTPSAYLDEESENWFADGHVDHAAFLQLAEAHVNETGPSHWGPTWREDIANPDFIEHIWATDFDDYFTILPKNQSAENRPQGAYPLTRYRV